MCCRVQSNIRQGEVFGGVTSCRQTNKEILQDVFHILKMHETDVTNESNDVLEFSIPVTLRGSNPEIQLSKIILDDTQENRESGWNSKLIITSLDLVPLRKSDQCFVG